MKKLRAINSRIWALWQNPRIWRMTRNLGVVAIVVTAVSMPIIIEDDYESAEYSTNVGWEDYKRNLNILAQESSGPWMEAWLTLHSTGYDGLMYGVTDDYLTYEEMAALERSLFYMGERGEVARTFSLTAIREQLLEDAETDVVSELLIALILLIAFWLLMTERVKTLTARTMPDYEKKPLIGTNKRQRAEQGFDDSESDS